MSDTVGPPRWRRFPDPRDRLIIALFAQLEAERQRSALLRERASLIDRSFKAGETPLPELLRALAAATQADTSFARQQVALGLALARLQQSLGILP